MTALRAPSLGPHALGARAELGPCPWAEHAPPPAEAEGLSPSPTGFSETQAPAAEGLLPEAHPWKGLYGAPRAPASPSRGDPAWHCDSGHCRGH